MNQSLSLPNKDSATAYSAEWQFLRAAATQNPAEADLANSFERLAAIAGEQSFDWKSFQRLADRHGLTSILYRNLAPRPELVPAAIFDSLRQSYESNVRKSLLLARELMRVLECAGRLGIELIPYKGISLAETWYGDVALRPVGDIDVFVRAKDAIRMKNGVRELGYLLRHEIPKAGEARYIDSGYEFTFDSPAGKNVLELQWQLQPRFYAADYDIEGLFARAAVTKVAGQGVRTLSAEDLLLVLSIHAAKHVWERLIWLCDIAQILRHHALNWEFIRREAHGLGVSRILHVTFLLTNRFIGTDIPSAIAADVRSDGEAQEFAEEISRSVIVGVNYEEQKIFYFRLMMRLRERPSDRLRFLTRLVFTPGPGEWQSMPLPPALSPLYRMIRLARIATRFARTSSPHPSE